MSDKLQLELNEEEAHLVGFLLSCSYINEIKATGALHGQDIKKMAEEIKDRLIQAYKGINQHPLTETEKDILRDRGWEFAGEDYIYIPDDYDGQMASGIQTIRRLLRKIQRKNKVG